MPEVRGNGKEVSLVVVAATVSLWNASWQWLFCGGRDLKPKQLRAVGGGTFWVLQFFRIS